MCTSICHDILGHLMSRRDVITSRDVTAWHLDIIHWHLGKDIDNEGTSREGASTLRRFHCTRTLRATNLDTIINETWQFLAPKLHLGDKWVSQSRRADLFHPSPPKGLTFGFLYLGHIKVKTPFLTKFGCSELSVRSCSKPHHYSLSQNKCVSCDAVLSSFLQTAPNIRIL